MGKRNTPEKPRDKKTGMKSALIAGLVTLAWASPAPQYSGQTQDLSDGQLDTIKDIFGTDTGDAYSGDQQTGRLEDGSNGVEAIVQVVKNEDGYVAPDDYQQTQGALTDKATSNVDNVFENCADYTESQGYECVPYYQCHNGTIITDGGGLIDIKKAAALAKGIKAQETLNKYSQCNVFWQPIDAAPLTTGGNGYVDGSDVDIS